MLCDKTWYDGGYMCVEIDSKCPYVSPDSETCPVYQQQLMRRLIGNGGRKGALDKAGANQ